MFYDQFGRLAVYQIVLVSLGVLVLLVGVWVVSAVQPTGGGVDMGTWVEEEDEGMEFEETTTSPLFHRRRSGSDSEHVSSPISDSPSPAAAVYNQPHPFTDTPTSVPDSPLSLTSAGPGRNRPRRRTRYGTLVPDLAPPGAPTGFSIGLGAASPGFVLRPDAGSFSHPHPGRGRSRSEDIRGIQAIMRGEVIWEAETESQREADLTGREGERERRKSWFGRFVGVGGKKGKIRLNDEGEEGEGGDGD